MSAIPWAVASFPPIRTQRLILRRFRSDDIPALLSYRNDPELARFDGVRPMTMEQAQRFLARQTVLPAGKPGEWLQIAVELPGTGLIGDCGFQVDREQVDSAEVGYRLGRQYWGQGYATEAVAGVLAWAFDTLNLHRVIALIDTRNARSIAVVERLGFRREAHLLESYREHGGWSDEYLYAMLEREWRSARP